MQTEQNQYGGPFIFRSEKSANGFEDICCEGGEQQQKTRLCEVWWRDPKGIHKSCCLFEESPEGVEVETRGKTCQRCSTNLDSEGATASVRPVYDGYKRWRDIETKVFLWWRDPWDPQQATKTGAHASISRGSRRTNSPSWPCRRN